MTLLLTLLLSAKIRLRGQLSAKCQLLSISAPYGGLYCDFIGKTLRIRCLFVSITRHIEFSGALERMRLAAMGKAPQKPDEKTKQGKLKPSFMARLPLWRERRLLISIIRGFLYSFRKYGTSIQIEHLHVELGIATADPFITGWLYGALQPLTLLNKPPRLGLSLRPLFTRTKPVFDLDFCISTLPIQVFAKVGVGLLSLPWLRMMRLMRAAIVRGG